MALSNSLFSGITGLKSHNMMLDVISNNIGNVNTTGYKKSRINFTDSLSQTGSMAAGARASSGIGGINAVQTGLGVSVQSVDIIMTQGALQQTGNPTDMALDGEGMFAVRVGNQILYTRAGDFTFDGVGNLVDRTGALVQGWNVDTQVFTRPFSSNVTDFPVYGTDYILDSTNIAGITNVNLQPGFTMEPRATEVIRWQGNLDTGTPQNPAALVDYTTGAPGGLPIYGPAGGLQTNAALNYYNAPVDFWNLDYAFPPVVGINNPADGIGDQIFQGETPDYQYSQVVYDSLGNQREVTFWFFQTTDLTTVLPPPPGPGTNGATFAWYAFETTNQPPQIYNLLGGTNIAEPFDRNLAGGFVVGEYVAFNPDGSLQNQGAVRSDGLMEYKPVLYLKELSWNTDPASVPPFLNVPPPPNNLVAPIQNWTTGTERTMAVAVDFGTAWPLAADDSVRDNWGPFGGPPPLTGPGKLMGVAQRDGLTGDATGYFDSGGNYVSRNNAAVVYQDGYAEGELLNVGVISDGTIMGSFSNNQGLALGKVAVARFANPSGLAKVGGSHFAVTGNSGFALMGSAEIGGRGSVRGGYLEQSNVDLTEELTQMIVAQRGFEVNSRVISTANSLLNTLVQLGQ